MNRPKEKKTMVFRGKRYHLSGIYATKIEAEEQGLRILKNARDEDLYETKIHITKETGHPHFYGGVHYALWIHWSPERSRYFGHLPVHREKHRASGKKGRGR